MACVRSGFEMCSVGGVMRVMVKGWTDGIRFGISPSNLALSH